LATLNEEVQVEKARIEEEKKRYILEIYAANQRIVVLGKQKKKAFSTAKTMIENFPQKLAYKDQVQEKYNETRKVYNEINQKRDQAHQEYRAFANDPHSNALPSQTYHETVEQILATKVEKEEIIEPHDILRFDHFPVDMPFRTIKNELNGNDGVIIFHDKLFYADQKTETVKEIKLTAHKSRKFRELTAKFPHPCKLADEDTLTFITTLLAIPLQTCALARMDQDPLSIAFDDVKSALKDHTVALILFDKRFFYVNSETKERKEIDIPEDKQSDFRNLRLAFPNRCKTADDTELTLITSLIRIDPIPVLDNFAIRAWDGYASHQYPAYTQVKSTIAELKKPAEEIKNENMNFRMLISHIYTFGSLLFTRLHTPTVFNASMRKPVRTVVENTLLGLEAALQKKQKKAEYLNTCISNAEQTIATLQNVETNIEGHIEELETDIAKMNLEIAKCQQDTALMKKMTDFCEEQVKEKRRLEQLEQARQEVFLRISQSRRPQQETLRFLLPSLYHYLSQESSSFPHSLARGFFGFTQPVFNAFGSLTSRERESTEPLALEYIGKVTKETLARAEEAEAEAEEKLRKAKTKLAEALLAKRKVNEEIKLADAADSDANDNENDPDCFIIEGESETEDAGKHLGKSEQIDITSNNEIMIDEYEAENTDDEDEEEIARLKEEVKDAETAYEAAAETTHVIRKGLIVRGIEKEELKDAIKYLKLEKQTGWYAIQGLTEDELPVYHFKIESITDINQEHFTTINTKFAEMDAVLSSIVNEANTADADIEDLVIRVRTLIQARNAMAQRIARECLLSKNSDPDINAVNQSAQHLQDTFDEHFMGTSYYAKIGIVVATVLVAAVVFTALICLPGLGISLAAAGGIAAAVGVSTLVGGGLTHYGVFKQERKMQNITRKIAKEAVTSTAKIPALRPPEPPLLENLLAQNDQKNDNSVDAPASPPPVPLKASGNPFNDPKLPQVHQAHNYNHFFVPPIPPSPKDSPIRGSNNPFDALLSKENSSVPVSNNPFDALLPEKNPSVPASKNPFANSESLEAFPAQNSDDDIANLFNPPADEKISSSETHKFLSNIFGNPH
jgi:hypothetical protein